MALAPLVEAVVPARDGTAQGDRLHPDLDPAGALLDPRSAADLIRLARRLAQQLIWRDDMNRAAGWWAAPAPGEEAVAPGDPPRGGPGFFDGIDPDVAAALLADPAAFMEAGRFDPAFAAYRRPHMALFLAAVGLIRHGQAAINALAARHLDHQLTHVLGLAPHPAEPPHAHLLFQLAPGVPAAEAPAGLRLLAGRDAGGADRLFALEEPLLVTRARVAELRSAFAERETVGLEEARRAIVGTPEEQLLFLLSLVYGQPRPGDPLPPLGDAPLSAARLEAIGRLIGYSRAGLHLELFELRAMLARQMARIGDLSDWARVNGFLEIAGRKKRSDPAWTLAPADPRDFPANLAKALDGPPDLSGLTEVETVEDLVRELHRPEVRTVISERLFLLPERQFAPMMATKRAIETDWAVVNAFLETAGRRRRNEPSWTLPAAPPHDFDANLAAAIDPFDPAAAGPEADGVATLQDYLARIARIEAWFHLSAEEVARLVETFGRPETDAAGRRRWREARALLTRAHGRVVRAAGARALAALRAAAPNQRAGLEAALDAALGRRVTADDVAEALGRHVPVADTALVAAALAGRPADWNRIDLILEEARRHRLRLPEPVPRRQRWRALWAAADATAVRPADGSAAFCPFGAPPAPSTDLPPADIGWAIASPVLALSAGTRRIVLTLGFHDDMGGPLVPPDAAPGSADARPFRVRLSTAEDWLDAGDAVVEVVDYGATAGVLPVDAGTPLRGLRFTILLNEAAPALTPPDGHFAGSRWPVLQLLLRPVWNETAGHWESAHDRFRALRLARVHVAVATGTFAASGGVPLEPLLAETEAGIANAKKPFEPFGPAPAPGAELALAHADLAHKKLTRVALRLEWQGAPADLAGWYAHYPPRSFTAQLVLADGARLTELGTPAALFAGNDGTAAVRIDRPLTTAGDPVRQDPPASPKEWRRHLLLRLSGSDFGHRLYPRLATEKSVALGAALRAGTTVNPADFVVNQPWTPKLKRIALELTAAHEVDFARPETMGQLDRLFHVEPFGEVELRPAPAGVPLLPAFTDEGRLYIGLADVDPPQPLSLLFAAAEEGGAVDRPGTARWHWLGPDGWADFPEPPDDGTNGLMARGIVRFALPEWPAGDSRLPRHLRWIRLSMAEGAANAAHLLGIHAQAARARLQAGEGAAAADIPAGTIRRLADPVPGIARLSQPYGASGGRAAEAADAFRVRASELQRHKGRAIAPWDYERLVLDRFPQVHKAKCLPATGDGDGPGQVRLVVVPDIRGAGRDDPFRPRAPAQLLAGIHDFVAPLMPPSAKLLVTHPEFVEVRVRLGVRFRPGGDVAHDRRRLADALNRHLAPWAFAEGADIVIGQRIDAVGIVAFVDGLSFVDFVGGCRLFVSRDGGASFQPGAEGGAAAEAGSPAAILVPARRHEIDLIEDMFFEADGFVGVGYMKVELDFVVA